MKEHVLNDPYQRGQQEYLERYGLFVEKARLWRVVGLSTTFLSVVLGSGLVYLANTSKFVPYFVQLDNNDKVSVKILASSPGEGELRKRTVAHQLRHWLQNTRSVVADNDVQRLHVARSFSLVASGSPAYNFLADYFSHKENNPYQRATKNTVTPEVTSILRPSSTTWQVNWKETITPLTGVGGTTKMYQALIGVKFRNAMSETEIVNNPTGLLVDSLTWSKINVEQK